MKCESERFVRLYVGPAITLATCSSRPLAPKMSAVIGSSLAATLKKIKMMAGWIHGKKNKL